MLNIISNEFFKPLSVVNGQTKVFRNLIKGLDVVGYPYVLNKKHDYCDKLWIYNDVSAVKHLKNIDTNKIKVLIGPDISFYWLLNKSINTSIVQKCVALYPSEWSRKIMVDDGFDFCKTAIWPVGIDTKSFVPSDEAKKDFVLIYFKKRFGFELSLLIRELKKRRVRHEVIVYGLYKESEYREKLKKTKYLIWVGQSESQGIALEEALSMNVPALIWDVSCFGHSDVRNSEISFSQMSASATSAPYFDQNCGLLIMNYQDLAKSIDFMENNLDNFRPREYILNNLSLEKQSRALISLFDEHWSDGDSFVSKNGGSWKNEFMWRALSFAYYKFKKIKFKK